MKKLVIFGDSIIKGVTFNGQAYHLCQQHDFDALAAQGVTTIQGVQHIHRGYESLTGDLAALGADITEQDTE